MGYIDCNNKDFDTQTIIGSLFSKITGTNNKITRIKISTIGDGSPIDCSAYKSLEDLFRRAIQLAADGFPALNVVITNYTGIGVELSAPNLPGEEVDWIEFARMAFVYDSTGEIAYHLGSIV